jgi:hypothetical protein
MSTTSTLQAADRFRLLEFQRVAAVPCNPHDSERARASFPEKSQNGAPTRMYHEVRGKL